MSIVKVKTETLIRRNKVNGVNGHLFMEGTVPPTTNYSKSSYSNKRYHTIRTANSTSPCSPHHEQTIVYSHILTSRISRLYLWDKLNQLIQLYSESLSSQESYITIFCDSLRPPLCPPFRFPSCARNLLQRTSKVSSREAFTPLNAN